MLQRVLTLQRPHPRVKYVLPLTKRRRHQLSKAKAVEVTGFAVPSAITHQYYLPVLLCSHRRYPAQKSSLCHASKWPSPPPTFAKTAKYIALGLSQPRHVQPLIDVRL